jgi:hypothetical protein
MAIDLNTYSTYREFVNTVKIIEKKNYRRNMYLPRYTSMGLGTVKGLNFVSV